MYVEPTTDPYAGALVVAVFIIFGLLAVICATSNAKHARRR